VFEATQLEAKFILEIVRALNLEKIPLHLYPRKPLDKDLSPIKSLINSKWICHE
jgi:hypothetical protein